MGKLKCSIILKELSQVLLSLIVGHVDLARVYFASSQLMMYIKTLILILI